MNSKLPFKKIISSVLSVLIVFSCSFAAYGETVEQQIELSLAPMYSEEYDIELSNSLTPFQERLAESINTQLKAYKKEVDISDFYLPYTEANKRLIVTILSGELPECFHISVSFYIRYNNRYITGIIPTYEYTYAEYTKMLGECEAKARALLNGIEGNDFLTDEEKLLLIHDRIALNCEYDPLVLLDKDDPHISHTMYGVLGLGVAVCQGYAIAYGYLLDKIGIKNSYCSSTALCHAWNIVYLENKAYHVDITWDDAAWDMSGRVYHNNFLLSSDALWETGHKAYDYDTSPMSNKYDNYFWQDSYTAFTLVDNNIYYIDNVSGAVKRKIDGRVLFSVDKKWMVDSSRYWTGNYAKLDTDGKDLLYSLSDGIYRYNLESGTSAKIYSPVLPDSHNIFGFTLDGGEMIVEACYSPNYDENTKINYTKRITYYPADASSFDHIPGDINGDAAVRLADLVNLSQYIAGWDVYVNAVALDVNNDKTVDLRDVSHLAKLVAKWESVVAY